MRRAVPAAAFAQAKQGLSPSPSGNVRRIGDAYSPRSGMMATPEALCEALHGMRHYIVRRLKHGALSLHREPPPAPPPHRYSISRVLALRPFLGAYIAVCSFGLQAGTTGSSCWRLAPRAAGSRPSSGSTPTPRH